MSLNTDLMECYSHLQAEKNQDERLKWVIYKKSLGQHKHKLRPVLPHEFLHRVVKFGDYCSNGSPYLDTQCQLEPSSLGGYIQATAIKDESGFFFQMNKYRYITFKAASQRFFGDGGRNPKLGPGFFLDIQSLLWSQYSREAIAKFPIHYWKLA